MRSEPNPYAAPSNDAPSVQATGPLRAARRKTRLAAAVIDLGLLGAVLFLGFVLACALLIARWLPLINAGQSAHEVMDRSAGAPIVYACTLPPPLLFHAYQCFLVARSGQSLGKRWLGLRIVRTNGEGAGFVHGVVMRSWLLNLIGLVPILGVLVTLADVLMIFWRDALCVHDVIADTRVVDIRASQR